MTRSATSGHDAVCRANGRFDDGVQVRRACGEGQETALRELPSLPRFTVLRPAAPAALQFEGATSAAAVALLSMSLRGEGTVPASFSLSSMSQQGRIGWAELPVLHPPARRQGGTSLEPAGLRRTGCRCLRISGRQITFVARARVRCSPQASGSPAHREERGAGWLLSQRPPGPGADVEGRAQRHPQDPAAAETVDSRRHGMSRCERRRVASRSIDDAGGGWIRRCRGPLATGVAMARRALNVAAA